MGRGLIERIEQIEKAIAANKARRFTNVEASQRVCDFFDRVTASAQGLIVKAESAAPIVDNFDYRDQRDRFDRGLQMLSILHKAADRQQNQLTIGLLQEIGGLLRKASSIKATV